MWLLRAELVDVSPFRLSIAAMGRNDATGKHTKYRRDDTSIERVWDEEGAVSSEFFYVHILKGLFHT